jgi:hypothetical protein
VDTSWTPASRESRRFPALSESMTRSAKRTLRDTMLACARGIGAATEKARLDVRRHGFALWERHGASRRRCVELGRRVECGPRKLTRNLVTYNLAMVVNTAKIINLAV